MNTLNVKKQRMLFSILLGGCLLLLSSIVLEQKLSKEIQAEMTLNEKRTQYMLGKVKKNPWELSIAQNIQPVLKNLLKYNLPELLYLSQNNWSSRVKKIKVSIELGDESKNVSNGESSNCNINLAVEDKDYLTDEEQKELNFILLHEVAHCFVGKEVLNREKMNWVDLSKEQQDKMDDLFAKQEKMFLDSFCKDCEKKYAIASPAIVYHELLADAIAASWLLMIDPQLIDLEYLYKKRALEFVRNPLLAEHPSNFVLKDIENAFKNDKVITYEIIIKIVQKSLIEYLQEMQFHYDKLKIENNKESVV